MKTKKWINKCLILFSCVTTLAVLTPFLVSCSNNKQASSDAPTQPPPPITPEPPAPIVEPFIETEYLKLFYNTGVIRASQKYDNYFNWKNNLPYNYLPTEFTIPEKIDGYKVKIIDTNGFSSQNFTKVNISEGIGEIGTSAFAGTRKMTEVILPSTLKIIGESAFNQSGLLEIDFSNTQVSTIPYQAFMCYVGSLKKITISSNIKRIESYAFEASWVEEFIIKEGVEYIGQKAFEHLGDRRGHSSPPSLITINLPKSLKVIDERAFENSYVGYLNIPRESGLTIKKRAFYKSVLQGIHIPKGTIVEDYAFYSASLKSIGIDDDFDFVVAPELFQDGSILIVAAPNQKYLGKNIFGQNIKIEKEKINLPDIFVNWALPSANLGLDPNSWNTWSIWRLQNGGGVKPV